MGRHTDDGPGHTRSTGPIWIGDTGRHSDNDLEKDHRSRWRIALLWFMIALATIIMVMAFRSMVGSAQRVIDTGTGNSIGPVAPAVTETEVIETPGRTTTKTVPVPGPTVYRTISPAPTATPSPVPGPTVTKTVTVTAPAPTVYQRTPGPTETKTVTRCYTWKLIEIPCPG